MEHQSIIPRNHNKSNHETIEHLTTKKFKTKKWLQIYEIKSQGKVLI